MDDDNAPTHVELVYIVMALVDRQSRVEQLVLSAALALVSTLFGICSLLATQLWSATLPPS